MKTEFIDYTVMIPMSKIYNYDIASKFFEDMREICMKYNCHVITTQSPYKEEKEFETTIDKARWMVIHRNNDNSTTTTYMRDNKNNSIFDYNYGLSAYRFIMSAEVVVDLKNGKVVKNRFGPQSKVDSVQNVIYCKHCGIEIYQPWDGTDQGGLSGWRHYRDHYKKDFYYHCNHIMDTFAEPYN